MKFPRLVVLVLVLFCVSASGQTVVHSLAGLMPYLDDDGVDVVMAPGTYRITPEDVTSGLFSSNTLLSFTGSNSVFDFTGVTIEVETEVFQMFGNVEVIELAVWGDDLVLKNLTMIDIGTTRPRKTALGVLLDGARNRVEGFSMTIRGSYPYGYGDMFGKGAGYVIKHYKHSAILVRGDDNHVKDCEIFHRAYGHGIFCQGSVNARIEGCYLEGELRTTDEVLAEDGTGSHADVVDFMTVWGWLLTPGDTFSLQEDGIRAYNTGAGPDGESRHTENMEVIDCTVKNMRSGVTIGFCNGTKRVENCVSLGTENGFWVGTEGEIINCAGDARIGPLFTTAYQNDRDSIVDLTVLDSGGPHTNNVVAYVGGSGHDLTFRNASPDVDPDLKIMLGGEKEGFRWTEINPTYNDFSTNNVTLRNLTNYRVVLGAKSSNTSGQSAGPVTDDGSGNSLSPATVAGCGGFSILRTIEAEEFCARSGVAVETSGGRENVGSIDDGDWIRFDDVFFGAGPRGFEALAAGGAAGGAIELRLDAVDGPLMGTCTVAPNPTPGQWRTEIAELTGPRGLHDLVLVFQGSAGSLMNLDSFKLTYWREDRGDRDAEHLVGHWKLDDGVGDVATDSSGHAHDGTVTGAAWVPGLKNTALEFAASGDQVALPGAAFAGIENEITISMLIHGDASQPSADSVLYAENASGDRVLNIHLPYDDGMVYWDAGNTGGYERINRIADPDQFKNGWNHWVFTKNTTEQTMKAYHNGVLHVAGIGLGNTMSGIAEAVLGTRIGTQNYTGVIDEVKLYNVALTEKEIAALFSADMGNAPPEALPVVTSVRRDRSVAINLTGTDDAAEVLIFTLDDLPAHGTLAGTPPDLVYTPAPGFLGDDSFTFRVSDGELHSVPASVSVTVRDRRLLAHWAMDDGGGTQVSDSSGNGNHGVLVSGSWVSGFDGGALEFDGVGDRVSLPAAAFAGLTDEVTVAMWVYGAASQPRQDSLFYAVDGNGDRLLNIHLPWTGPRVYWDAGNGAGYDRIWKEAPDVNDFSGRWNHWVFTKSAVTGRMSIHLNGALWHSGGGKERMMSGVTAATLGSQTSPGMEYAGMMDEVMLYDYAMTDMEVAALFTADTGTAFDVWLTGYPGLSDPSWDGDPDHDGIPTGIEYVLNGSPETRDAMMLPSVSGTAGEVVFTFTRRVGSSEDTTQTFQYSTDPSGGWTDVSITAPTAPEVSVGPEADGLQTVTVTLSTALAAEGRLFGRLAVERVGF